MRNLTNAEKKWGTPLPRMAGGDPALTETDERSLLQKMYDRRAELAEEINPLIEARETETAEFEVREQAEKDDEKPTAEERKEFAEAEQRFNEDLQGKEREIKALDLRIDRQELVERGNDIAQRASAREGTYRITHEPEVYARNGDKNASSYYLDLACRAHPSLASKLGPKTDGWEARLEKHKNMMEDVLPKRDAQRERDAEKRIEEGERATRGRLGIEARSLEESPFEKRAPSRTPGQGGYFVPPLWLIDEYIPYLRPGRVAAELCRHIPLPPGTDSINVPKLTTPTVVGIQTQDNAPLPSQDIKDNFINAGVKTIAGFADLPLQLIEQSPGTIIDMVVTRDMMAAYDVTLDQQVVTGNGVGAPLSGGQIVGLYPATNWESTKVTWTAASPTGQGFFQLLGAVASKTAYSRFNLQDFAYLMHPRRWFWGATYTDTVGRPLVEGGGFNNFNSTMASIGDQTPFEGLVGRVPFGPKAYIDANIPVTDTGHETASKGDADIAIGAIWDDIWLMEGDIRTDVFDQTLSGTMEIRFRLYNYVALLQRYGQSVSIATGSGFAPPSTIDGTPY